ncbi:hypothetical protein NDI52_33305 [Leptolyngbya sp. PL-A3]|uniref:hypothetical protein n=1 Tax=Leptolyngbya sp. PL-A3 TaxID=2933911 RepID=UPI003298ECE5
MTLTEQIKGVARYRYVRRSKSNGTWGVWAPDSNQTQGNEWRNELEIRRSLRAQQEAQQRAESIPSGERDRHYQRLLSCLTLNPKDRADLHRRGLTEAQIKAGGFVSVKQWQRLPEEFPTTLPGVNIDGRSLNVSGAGYLCPIRDVDGLLVGLQLRLRDAENGRYRWLTSVTKKRPNGQPPNLPNGELPLAVFRPEQFQPEAIALVEGTGAKPFITSLRRSIITIGAAGGQFPSSPQTLQTTLEKLTAELGINRIEFYPDAGSLQNPNVLRQYQATWELVTGWGYSVHIAWWGQLEKSSFDIDELKELDHLQFITPAAFLAMAPEGTAAALITQQGPEQARDRYRAETDRIMAEFNSLRVQPTITEYGRYIPSGLLQLPTTAGSILIDGPMGTGKTSTGLKELVQQHRRRYPKAFRCLLTPRNALGRQSAAVLGLPHHTEFKGFGQCPSEVTLCPESGWRFPTNRLPDGPPLILIDEVSQLLHQVLEGKTSKQNHALILTWMRSLFRWVREQGGWIVLSEDGITNLELDLISEASGLPVVEFLKFERTDTKARDILLFDSPSMTWLEIKRRLACGENLILGSDSAKWLHETREMAIAIGMDPEDIWLIDSETSSEDWAQQLSTDPDGWILRHRPRILGYSPTFQQGISIADPSGHFQAMGLHLVHLDWRSAKQMPERLRSDVPRFGYVKERGTNTDEFFSSCRPDAIMRDFYRNAEGVKKLTQFAEYVQSKSVTDADGNPLDLIAKLNELQASQDEPDSVFGFWLRHYARYRARATYNRLGLRESLIDLWRARGHNVQLIEGRAPEETKERKRIQEGLEQAEASTFAQLDTGELSVSDARSILEDIEATKEQRELAHKRLLQDKLPGVNLDNPEFVLKVIVQDSGRFLKTAELLWMSRNPRAAEWLDRWTWINEFTQAAKRDQFVSYARLSWRSGQAKLLNECPLQPFIDGRILQWDNNTPEAIAVHRWALMRKHQLRRYLRLNVSETHTPVTTVNKLLRYLKFEVQHVGWKGSREERERQYNISNLQDFDRETIIKALEERFIKRLQDKEGTSEPSESIPVIATRIDNLPLTSCDHRPQPDWSICPPEWVEDFKKAWSVAITAEERVQVIADVESFREAIA